MTGVLPAEFIASYGNPAYAQAYVWKRQGKSVADICFGLGLTRQQAREALFSVGVRYQRWKVAQDKPIGGRCKICKRRIDDHAYASIPAHVSCVTQLMDVDYSSNSTGHKPAIPQVWLPMWIPQHTLPGLRVQEVLL